MSESGRPGVGGRGLRRIVFYTREDCSLCETAESALAALARPLGLMIEVQDVDADPGLVALYGDRVPVVMEGEVVLAEGRIEAAALRAAIETAFAAAED
ncbi:MAG TPA: glutaredoxin family protein [Dehalococcoidia bacterium]|nr:glutaredoxin family protein [Dehalococcoidia bacterium]